MSCFLVKGAGTWVCSAGLLVEKGETWEGVEVAAGRIALFMRDLEQRGDFGVDEGIFERFSFLVRVRELTPGGWVVVLLK